ncbi:MAG: hypothetical protein HYX41_05715 [Bdellovibrio sp.]|nr:hypothetical protein [Bdellovibrio sp.]
MTQTQKRIEKAREKVLKIFNQAKDSLKILQEIEKETLTKAKSFVPDLEEQKKLTNAKILAGLKRMGVATQDEILTLSTKIKALEAHTKNTKPRTTSKSASKG